MSGDVDVVIAGGGVIGTSCAYHLKCELGYAGSVLVVERDPSYAFAASTRSASSIRLQFSTPVNIALSRHGIGFLREAARRRDGAGFAADVGLVESTYLYLATPQGCRSLEARAAVQRAHSVPLSTHDAAALARRYPWLNTADLAAGCDTQGGEGWFDGQALLMGLKAAAQAAGVDYLNDCIVGLEKSAQRIEAVRLERGPPIRCGALVNATGTRSRTLAAWAGVELPVVPRKRNVFVFTCASSLPRIPLVVDPGGLWFRSEGDRFLCGPPTDPDADAAPDDFEVDYDLFERVAWPALAHRVPAFEAIRMTGAWSGHYDYNTFDQNAFLGPMPEIPNLILASGFSGHGLQHAPGVGRGLAEHLCFGEYRSLDLGPLGIERYLERRPLREINVI